MSTEGYSGQKGLTDDKDDYNVWTFIIQQALGAVRTMTLVKVVSVTNEGGVSPVGFVDVHPLVNQTDGVGTSTPHGKVLNLPYVRLQGGANAVIIDPQVGDIGLAIVSDRDISSVKATKDEANPGSKRRFSLSDGVYLGGVLNGAPEQYVRFFDGGIEMVDANGNVLKTSASGFEVTTAPGGDFIVNGVSVTRHLHTSAAAGSPTSPPIPG